MYRQGHTGAQISCEAEQIPNEAFRLLSRILKLHGDCSFDVSFSVYITRSEQQQNVQ